MRADCRGETLRPQSDLSSTIRRTLVAWAALAGLLAAPVAETVHEFQHLAPVRSDSQSKGAGGVKPACEICAAYSAMGHALWTPPLLLLQDPGAPQRVVLRERGRTVAPAYAYQERAPPPSSPSA
jgi:hypothetical protein